MKEWVFFVAMYVLTPCAFAKNQEGNDERPCSAIALMEEYFLIVQTEDAKKAGTKFEAAESWYLQCKSNLLEADRDRLDRERENAKSSLAWSRTIEKAVLEIIAKLDEPSRDALKSSKKNDLIQYHLTLGMVIRNELGLWNGNQTLLLSACGGTYCHPDDASMKIIEGVWQQLQNPSSSKTK